MKDVTLAQVTQVLNLILQKQIPGDQLEKLLGSGLLSDLLEANFDAGIDRNEFRRLIGLKAPTFRVIVNYELPVEDAVRVGNYDSRDESISSKNFPPKRQGIVEREITLVDFDGAVGSKDVLLELEKQGLRAAELPELLALGAKYPDMQRRNPVVALGSIWQQPDGNREVPYLASSDKNLRSLELRWFALSWNKYYRFAALRK